MPRRLHAFTMVELLVSIALIAVLATVVTQGAQHVYRQSSLAVSANNIRALAAGGAGYLLDNNHRYWRYLDRTPEGSRWWWGLESPASSSRPEGERSFDPAAGPLAGYVPAAIRPDPSFAMQGNAFKPKYRNGYIGVGYNVLLGGGWMWATPNGSNATKSYWQLAHPGKVVVFATSAQVYPFNRGGTPQIEEFYGLDERYATVHFRHAGNAMVAFANGSAGFLPMDESTRDARLPEANIGRFAPVGSKKYLE